MKIIQTPEERFANLPDYPFVPHYAEIPDLEGGTQGFYRCDRPVLFVCLARRHCRCRGRGDLWRFAGPVEIRRESPARCAARASV